ncbi:hypothetical protein F8388_022147 [Cannabis sativa]|uniref:Reverse transcriptase zinc-binding domain-containing protein n=1 Tax=Cannabis sativa TaxID=3483 RepID=A0A7J6GA72_CANSA|nr:hypothetical protein F8388_022147 [Cannabis sativa]
MASNARPVRILNSPWLPDTLNSCVISSHPSLTGENVNQLMICDDNQWGEDIVKDLFEDRDRDHILSIPLNSTNLDDKWYWLHKNLGNYYIKSSYRWLQSSKGNWCIAMESKLWHSLWKTKVPLKVLHFAWKAISGCLLTRLQLHSKHIPFQLKLVFCSREEESILHPSMFEEALMVSWSIWKDRNDFLWNKKINVIANVIVSVHSVLNQWNLARSNRFELLPVILHTYSSGEHWTAPDVGFVKVNVDGAVFAASQSYGVGGIARGNDGRVIEAFSLHKANCVHPSLVEAIGVQVWGGVGVWVWGSGPQIKEVSAVESSGAQLQ